MKIVYVLLLMLILSGCKSEISDKKSNDNFTYSETDNDAVSESEIYSEAESEVNSENIQYSETEYITTEEYIYIGNDRYEAKEYEETKKRAYEWLKEYEGEWVVDDLLCYYSAGDAEPSDSVYDYYINAIPLPNDKYIGMNISIDLDNDIFKLGDEDIFKITYAEEISKEYFIARSFSPKSQFTAKKIINDTWYKTDDNKSDKYVKCINIDCFHASTGEIDYDKCYELAIPGDGNLYANIWGSEGTYVLKRKEK